MEKWCVCKDGYAVSSNGRVKNITNGNILTPRKHTHGYLRVQIRDVDYYIHRLVAECFVNNPEGKKEVNHIDLDKTNNAASNLEWVTHGENIAYGYKMGSRKNPGAGKFGAKNVNYKPIVAINGTAIIQADSQVEMANYLGVTRGSIGSALLAKHRCKGFTIIYE